MMRTIPFKFQNCFDVPECAHSLQKKATFVNKQFADFDTEGQEQLHC